MTTSHSCLRGTRNLRWPRQWIRVDGAMIGQEVPAKRQRDENMCSTGKLMHKSLYPKTGNRPGVWSMGERVSCHVHTEWNATKNNKGAKRGYTQCGWISETLCCWVKEAFFFDKRGHSVWFYLYKILKTICDGQISERCLPWGNEGWGLTWKRQEGTSWADGHVLSS